MWSAERGPSLLADTPESIDREKFNELNATAFERGDGLKVLIFIWIKLQGILAVFDALKDWAKLTLGGIIGI